MKRYRKFVDSLLEETVSSEPVSKNPISKGRPKRERAYKN